VNNRLTDAELLGLEAKLGALWRFSPRSPTNHYRLNMDKKEEKLLAQRLIQIAREEKSYRRVYMKENGVMSSIDTSQKGDGENFRNERIDLLDGTGWQAFDFDARRPPEHGMVDFDYVSTDVGHRLTDHTKVVSWTLFKLLSLDILRLHRSVRARDISPEEEVLPEGQVQGVRKNLWDNLKSDAMFEKGRDWWKDVDSTSEGTRTPISRPSTRENDASPRSSLDGGSRPSSRGSIGETLFIGDARPNSRDRMLSKVRLGLESCLHFL
jgi:hypothetical protein